MSVKKTDLDSDCIPQVAALFRRCLENPDILAALEKGGIKKESIWRALIYLEVPQNKLPTWIKWLITVVIILLRILEKYRYVI